MPRIERATDMRLVREMLEEYARATHVDLSFQNFDHELDTLPYEYDPILMAWSDVRQILLSVDAQTGVSVPLVWCLRNSLPVVAGAEGPDARRRDAGDAVASSRSGNEADGPSPPATLRAGGGCGRSAASLVVNDVTTSPPPRSLHLARKRHQRQASYF